MAVSKKCQYAVQAVFELAKRYGPEPVKIVQIAQAQAIPARFLEAILNQLRQAGLLESRRGPEGGYVLAIPPSQLTLWAVVRSIEGTSEMPSNTAEAAFGPTRIPGLSVFESVWKKAERAVAEVLDSITFDELVEEESRILAEQGEYVPMYAI
ncbi:MAG: RrF2 family transcriptional regulator [Thermoguttaceae bacterium]